MTSLQQPIVESERPDQSPQSGCGVVRDALYDDFRVLMEAELGEFQHGRGELRERVFDGRLITSLVDRDRRFAILKWVRCSDGCVEEAFFVPGASGTARTGWRKWLAGSAGRVGVPDWWPALVQCKDLLQDLGAAAPSFEQLVTVYAAGSPTLLNVQRPSGQAEIDELRSEVQRLSDQCRIVAAERRSLLEWAGQLGGALSFAAPESSKTEATFHTDPTFERLDIWCANNADRVVVLNRALQNTRKSRFERPGEVFAALDLLAGPYRDLKMGQGSRETLESELGRWSFNLSRSGGETTLTSEGAYTVKWNGQRRVLEQHLGKRGGREERFSMRIYFFWDAESQRVVVGWMPSHLPNSLS